MASYLFLLFGVSSSASSGLEVRVNKSTGAVTVLVENEVWLSSSEVVVGSRAASRGELELASIASRIGSDVLGNFEATLASWVVANGTEVLRTEVRAYAELATFEQSFPVGVAGLSTTFGRSASTAFPAFDRTSRRCAAYQDDFPRLESGTLESYEETVEAGSPLLVFGANAALVFSSLDEHKAQHMVSSESWVGAGVKATVSEIPANWTQRWILASAVDARAKAPPARAAFRKWGDAVLRFHGVANDLEANMYRDAVHSTIGFWTDNGGYYHYSTGPGNETYERALLRVKDYHDDIGAPFGHWQFDSWFYPKDGNLANGGVESSSSCSTGGKKGATTNWTALESVFPSGMAAMNRALDGMPMVLHNKELSPVSDYIVNGVPVVEWLSTGAPPYGAAVPRDPDTFFRWFFRQQRGWGLSHYEQDWTCFTYNTVSALQTNITLADDMLRAMARAAANAANPLTIQYCMAYPYDVLAASLLPPVTTARATHDYFHAENRTNWAIGHASLFYSALGILPFKDGFLSSNETQPGGQNQGPETNPDREILMAVLSGSIVAAMDGLGYLNKTRLMAACRADGVVLKPDRPLSVADFCFRDDQAPPERCYVYEAHTDLSLDDHRIHYLYLDDRTDFRMTMLDTPSNRDHVLYNWYTRDMTILDAGDDAVRVVTPGYENHSYVVVAPIVDGWAFLGDLDKYVVASKIRFPNVTVVSEEILLATVRGVRNESFSVCAVCCSSSVPLLRCATATFSDQPYDVSTRTQDILVAILAPPSAPRGTHEFG